MKIKHLSPKSITPYENNPRINEQAVDAVARSIQEFGFRQPIVVDSDHVIIVGHTRYLAALKLELKKIPVHVAEDLTDEQIKAYRLADNQTGDLAEWDQELLTAELRELAEIDFDLSAIGFDDESLNGYLADTLAQTTTTTLPAGSIEPAAPPEDPQQAETFELTVECGSEEKRKSLISQLRELGYVCRPID